LSIFGAIHMGGFSQSRPLPKLSPIGNTPTNEATARDELLSCTAGGVRGVVFLGTQRGVFPLGVLLSPALRELADEDREKGFTAGIDCFRHPDIRAAGVPDCVIGHNDCPPHPVIPLEGVQQLRGSSRTVSTLEFGCTYVGASVG